MKYCWEALMLDSTEEKLARLAKVSYLYYKEGKNQVEVAEAMGLARPMVSRQLKEAEESGIVKINVEYPIRSRRLEKIFMERFGISEVRIYIVEENDPQKAKALLGSAASRFFSEETAGAKRIAISWGSTLYEMVNHIEGKTAENMEVVQLIGATGREHNPNDGPVVARDLAERLDARLYLLHAPLVVESEMVASALMKDKVVLETLNKARMADIAFVGIGSLEKDKNSLFKAGYISEKELELIKASGGVGDTCARFYDAKGRILDIDINRRVIGLPPDELEKLPRVIAVSLGEEKARGILGALLGKRVKGLITDFRTAEKVIALQDESGL
jgi:DNA-binding transcriptional regulator LsrR (DeoR family)